MNKQTTILIPFLVAFAMGCNDGDDKGGDTDTDMTSDTDTDTTVDTDDTDDVVGMPRGAANPPSLGARIDRVGRPAISTATVLTFAPDADKNTARDMWNSEGPAQWSDWEDEIMDSLAILDSLDGTCGNQLIADGTANRYEALAQVLADDQLYVLSTTGTCGVYLGLEAEVVGALESGEGGCGGRMPADDVIDRSYSVLAAGILTGVDDTITADDVPTLPTFPFLAQP